MKCYEKLFSNLAKVIKSIGLDNFSSSNRKYFNTVRLNTNEFLPVIYSQDSRSAKPFSLNSFLILLSSLLLDII